jgi:predicted nucleotidyltransferase
MDIQVRPNHQAYLNRFEEACRSDERVLAALLVGSYVKGTNDEHSDLDLYVITKDEAYNEFVSRRDSFVRSLGEPAFMEDFGLPGILFLIFPDGAEVEISFIPENQLAQVFDEPYQVLLDKKNITAGVISHRRQVDQAAQRERLRRLIYWFWHNFSHFVTALARNQLWWAQGQLEELRAQCVGLARLRNDFSDPEVEGEVYFKIENAMPVEQLAPLQDTFCPMEKDAMLASADAIVDFYRESARSLAPAHEIIYPDALEKVMVKRLKAIREDIV